MKILDSIVFARFVNALVRIPLRLLVLHTGFAVLAGFAAVPVMAQTTSATTAAPAESAPAGRINQTIERIRTEDASVRIDELRVGGETQSITVQPKAGDGDSNSSFLPAYEINAADGARGAAPGTRNGNAARTGSTSGARVWNLFKF